jgi:hypothetical protein
MHKVERVYDDLLQRYPGVREGHRWWKPART